MNITAIIIATVVVAGVGLFIGIFLGVAGMEFEVEVNEKEEAGKITYEVKVDDRDMGRVIGKQGKVANSIRTLMKALGSKEKKKVVIEFLG